MCAGSPIVAALCSSRSPPERNSRPTRDEVIDRRRRVHVEHLVRALGVGACAQAVDEEKSRATVDQLLDVYSCDGLVKMSEISLIFGS